MVSRRWFSPVLTSLLLGVAAMGWAQTKRELRFIMSHNPLPLSSPLSSAVSLGRETSEIKLLAMGMIRGYQTLISSQQSEKVCTFTPSCSHYGLAAIKTYGMPLGILTASDRLQRCHGFGVKPYPVDRQTGKFIDPLPAHDLPIDFQ